MVFCSPQGPALECRSGGNLGVYQSDNSYIYMVVTRPVSPDCTIFMGGCLLLKLAV